jgi:hypothetical protein
VLLTPGVLLTLPPSTKGIWMSGQSTLLSTGVHTLVFALVFAFLRKNFASYY